MNSDDYAARLELPNGETARLEWSTDGKDVHLEIDGDYVANRGPAALSILADRVGSGKAELTIEIERYPDDAATEEIR